MTFVPEKDNARLGFYLQGDLLTLGCVCTRDGRMKDEYLPEALLD